MMGCSAESSMKVTEPFEVTTGVRQGCLLSPFLFLLAVDWIIRKATEDKRNGIQWTPFEQQEDLDFADDIALLSHKHEQAQNNLNAVEEKAVEVGLRINTARPRCCEPTPQTNYL